MRACCRACCRVLRTLCVQYPARLRNLMVVDALSVGEMQVNTFVLSDTKANAAGLLVAERLCRVWAASSDSPRIRWAIHLCAFAHFPRVRQTGFLKIRNLSIDS